MIPWTKAEVYRITPSSSSFGGFGEIETKVEDALFYINLKSQGEQYIQDQKRYIEPYNGYCPPETDVRIHDIIKQEGIKWRVLSTPKNTANRNHHIKLWLERVSSD